MLVIPPAVEVMLIELAALIVSAPDKETKLVLSPLLLSIPPVIDAPPELIVKTLALIVSIDGRVPPHIILLLALGATARR